jgi:4-hydroxythreonine-4-phosphate dehydrogenase
MGDPAGIGPEISVGAWQVLRGSGLSFVLLADPALLAGSGLPVQVVGDVAEAAAVFAEALPVLPVPLAAPVVAGRPDPANGAAVIASIEQATRLALSGAVAGMVTNPISKATLYNVGFAYPGHTEFLGALCGLAEAPVMMLASPMLRVVPVTIHVSLQRALAMLRPELIIHAARVTAMALRRDFGIAAPRLAIAGLNPHAGESGTMGDEEATLVEPALAVLRADGIDASGPWPPDTMFTALARPRYDAAICLYHDQALIPIKTLDMENGVNVTLGLPILRTSPDHGTAFDIAGRGIASPASLLAALRLAGELARRRVGAA